MKKTVEIGAYGSGDHATFDTDKVQEYTVNGETYDETVIADDGRCIAYDAASNMWVVLWYTTPDDYAQGGALNG